MRGARSMIKSSGWPHPFILYVVIIFFQSIQYSAFPASRVVYIEIYKNTILYDKGVSEIEYSLSLYRLR